MDQNTQRDSRLGCAGVKYGSLVLPGVLIVLHVRFSQTATAGKLELQSACCLCKIT